MHEGETIGTVTSGSFSPTLDTSIGMGYVLERYVEPGAALDLDIRGRTVQVTVTELPFYKRPRRA
jgi:aminomethyltransferase